MINTIKVTKESDLYLFEDFMLFLKNTTNKTVFVYDMIFNKNYMPYEIKKIQKILNNHNISFHNTIHIPDSLVSIKNLVTWRKQKWHGYGEETK